MELVKPHKMLEAMPFEHIDVKAENPQSMFELGKNLALFARENKGIGLAAPQVGIYRNIMVFLDEEANYVIAINPRYTAKASRMQVKEQCLSFPGEEATVKRYKAIKARFWTLTSEHKFKFVELSLKGTPAIIFQHEVDHLHGKCLGRKIGNLI